MSSLSNQLNITTPKYVLFGSGIGFDMINDKFHILDGASFFIETTPDVKEKHGKHVLSIDEFLGGNYPIEEYSILICNRFWKHLREEERYKRLRHYTVIDIYNTKLSDDLNENIEMKQFYPQIKKFIGNYCDIDTRPCDGKEKILIMVQEWAATVVPYQQIVLGMLLRANGANVEFLLNDQSFYGEVFLHEGVIAYQNKILIELLEEVKDISGIPYHRLSASDQIELNDQEHRMMSRGLYLSTVWSLRNIFLDENSELKKHVDHKWFNNARSIKGFLSKHDYHKVIAFTGIHYDWFILHELAKQLGNQVYTYEYVRGLTFSKSSPAVLQKDLRFMESKEFSPSHLSYFYAFSDEHIKTNYKFKTIKNAQKSVLIPLNIFWDSAAFGEDDVFVYFDQWLVKTIDYILTHHSVKVIVRQHPHERRFGSGKEVASLLLSKFGDNPLFEFIPASSDADSYELIENASIILPNTSTVGMEAALIGKNVIVKNDVYYADFGFVKKAASEQEYFQLITEALQQEQECILTDDQISKAKLFFALNIHNSVDHSFGFLKSDFMQWIDEGWETINNYRSTRWFIDMVINDRTLLENYLNEPVSSRFFS